MKRFIYALAMLVFASAAPNVASAADLGRDYGDRDAYVERPLPPPPPPRVIYYGGSPYWGGSVYWGAPVYWGHELIGVHVGEVAVIGEVLVGEFAPDGAVRVGEVDLAGADEVGECTTAGKPFRVKGG